MLTYILLIPVENYSFIPKLLVSYRGYQDNIALNEFGYNLTVKLTL